MTPISPTERQRAGLEGAAVHTPAITPCCRAQALLWLAEGESIETVADPLHVSRQTVYNRVNRFPERDGLDLGARLSDARRAGRPGTGGGVIDPPIAEVIDSDPRTLGERATVWTASLLSRYLRENHQIAACDRTVSRAVARLGIRWKRPRHQLARRPDSWRQSCTGRSTSGPATWHR